VLSIPSVDEDDDGDEDFGSNEDLMDGDGDDDVWVKPVDMIYECCDGTSFQSIDSSVL